MILKVGRMEIVFIRANLAVKAMRFKFVMSQIALAGATVIFIRAKLLILAAFFKRVIKRTILSAMEIASAAWPVP